MHRRIACVLLICLLTAGLARGGMAEGSPASWWTTRGRTLTHGNAAVEPFGELEFAWALEEMGLSASQPLFVDGVIYHLTEKGLWQITFDTAGRPVAENLVPAAVNEIAVDGVTRLRAPTAGLTYAAVGDEGKRALYFGTGSNKVCAYLLATKALDCHQLFGQEPIVSTPLVFEQHDVVIMGDKTGALWAVRGLATGNQHHLHDIRRRSVNGAGTWITSSATPVRKVAGSMDFLFSAYVPGGGEGLVGRARVVLRSEGKPELIVLDVGVTEGELWTKALTDGHGMADGFTLHPAGNLAFVSDLRGEVYLIDVHTGSKEVRAPAGPRFANDMPATDQTGETVYFTMRNVGSGDSSFTAPGSLVAMDANTWQRKWEQPLGADVWAANTPPLVWGDVILLGTTRGYILGFSRADGRPASFAIKRLPPEYADQDSADPTRMWLLKEGEAPYQAAHSYQALSGAGVQPIVASGGRGETLLLVGVNYCESASVTASGTCTEGKGRLMAFRPMADDPYIAGVSCPPEAMEWFDGMIHTGFRTTGSAPFQGTLRLTWSDSAGNRGARDVALSLAPNGTGRQPLRVADMGPGTVSVTAEIILPAGFRDRSPQNNRRSCTVRVTVCPDCDAAPPAGPGSVLVDPYR